MARPAALAGLLVLLAAGRARAQQDVYAAVDPQTGSFTLPDPGPRPGYPQAHLWRPLALQRWQVELPVDGRLGLDAGAALAPSDVVFGGSLGIPGQLQASVLLDLRAAPGHGAESSSIARSLEIDATWAVYTSGTSSFAVAGSVWLWIALHANPALVLAPTLFGVWRIASVFGVRAALTVPFTLEITEHESLWLGVPAALAMPVAAVAGSKEALLFALRPEVQPLDWLWLGAGVGIGVRGASDLIVPVDFELGVTPWSHIDIYANFAFSDVQSLGADARTLTLGARGRI